MRLLIQRVKEASVTVDGILKSFIGKGLLVFVGIEDSDTDLDIEWLSNKLINLRIFDDDCGVMNISLLESGGDILIVSQFTLFASVKKGNRPSYIRASKSEVATKMYEKFCDTTQNLIGKKVKKGVFGANMEVRLLNDGPVTIWIDSKNKD